MGNLSHTSPNTIVEVVGEFPEITSSGYTFDKGPIQLRIGKHTAPNKGFGVKHIEAEHMQEILNLGFTSVNEFVKAIIVENAKIFCEFSDLKGNHRPIILKASIGIVVLERKFLESGTIYSVVTAYRRTNPHGIQIGTMK
ncbi:TPA: hypothetical protein PXF07_001952 [Mannheimia haemolytica]|uniref:Uncharacterized protein n=2 Tax=Mannheimia haemolytica TaxID=75985 RepID=A0A249A1W5_MANHA|nr:hypothetical protein [Mannheimia haemolytica]AWW72265.1 hypothetical protein C4O86_10965 [Pasteurellaceae bacterium 12565]AGI33564.1 hypothetical protein D650_22950 [Mannheimia haemolytica USDA-ARS-USMARC-183]AGI34522.1 hypothetical protein D648_5180 [Mannheimia haemolytica USDA-ARS-USMARC-185]AGK01520.1 hypothetical protein MHH_c10640 [Mannheimia haemolytica M42548]AGQ26346.1 hypothetical protein F382_10450 [Mannheimia haemolytica D153]